MAKTEVPDAPAPSFADALADFRAAFPAGRPGQPSSAELEDAFDRVFKEDRDGR